MYRQLFPTSLIFKRSPLLYTYRYLAIKPASTTGPDPFQKREESLENYAVYKHEEEILERLREKNMTEGNKIEDLALRQQAAKTARADFENKSSPDSTDWRSPTSDVSFAEFVSFRSDVLQRLERLEKRLK